MQDRIGEIDMKQVEDGYKAEERASAYTILFEPPVESDFSKKLNSNENIELLENVLRGNRPETDLLGNELFAPEKLLSESIPFKSFINKVITAAIHERANFVSQIYLFREFHDYVNG